MPIVHKNHLRSQEAVHEVCKILHEAGALTEEIRNDYGEDLLIQTHLEGQLDNFGILIQVKGRALKFDKNNTSSIKIRTDHLLRWRRHIMPMLLCVFDFKTGVTYAFSPARGFPIWRLTLTKQKYQTVKFSHSDTFSKKSASEFIWHSRMEYYSAILGASLSIINDLKVVERHVFNSSKPEIFSYYVEECRSTIYYFLIDVGILDNMQLTTKFKSSLEAAKKELEENLEKEDIMDSSILYQTAILEHCSSLYSGGLPFNISVHSANMLYNHVKFGNVFKRSTKHY